MSKRSLSDDELREAFRGWVAHDGGEGGPDPERVWDAVAGVADAPERQKVIAEMTKQPASLRWWLLADEVMPSEDRLGPKVERSEATTGWRSWLSSFRSRMVVLGGAAAATVALMVVVVTPDPDPGLVATHRQVGEPVFGSAIDNGARLSRRAPVLRWTCAIAADRFDVVVQTAGLDMVAAAQDLSRPEYRIPEGALSKVPTGTSLLWQVTAYGPDGAEMTSKAFDFILE